MGERFETVSINSKDRDNSSISTSDFDYTIKDSISIETDGLNVVKLTQLIIPYTFYSIVAGRNDTIPFDDNGDSFDATISPGNYTHTRLAVEIEDSINAELGVNTISVDYNSDTDAFDTTSPANFAYRWLLNPNNSTALANNVMGYDIVNTAFSTSSSSSKSPVIRPSQIYIGIKFDEASEEILQTKSNRHTFSIPIVSDFSELLVYKPDIPMIIQEFNKNVVIKKVKVTISEGGFENISLDLRGRNVEIELRFESL